MISFPDLFPRRRMVCYLLTVPSWVNPNCLSSAVCGGESPGAADATWGAQHCGGRRPLQGADLLPGAQLAAHLLPLGPPGKCRVLRLTHHSKQAPPCAENLLHHPVTTAALQSG